MARTGLSDINSLADPALSWNFDLFLPIIPGSSDTRDLTFRCMSTDLPGTQLEPVDVELHGVRVPFAGRRMYTQEMNVTFLETVDWATRQKFFNWCDIARSWVNNSGTQSTGYKVAGQITCYDDIPNIAANNNIVGLFPSTVGEIQLDGAQNSVVTLQVTFKYTLITPA